jgi:hypothetical protein
MHNSVKIITGLILFFLVISFPIWYNAASGKAAQRPELKIITPEKQCVAPKDYMRASHMELLNQWRDEVVRSGNRVFVSEDGRHYEMSLSRTCMSCHSNKADFCDQCHNYMGVTPYCWDCHIEPEES